MACRAGCASISWRHNVADSIYGFNARDVRRIAGAVRRAEREPVNRPQKRARWPILGGGDKLIPVEIVERVGELPDPPPLPEEDTRDPTAVHRLAPWIMDDTNEDAGFDVMRLTLERDALIIAGSTKRETAYANLLHGVYCTGDHCFAVQKFGKLFVIGGGVDAWHGATATEDIADTGTVLLYEDGPEVEARVMCGATVSEDSTLIVAFDDKEQEFVITLGCCPANTTTT